MSAHEVNLQPDRDGGVSLVCQDDGHAWRHDFTEPPTFQQVKNAQYDHDQDELARMPDGIYVELVGSLGPYPILWARVTTKPGHVQWWKGAGWTQSALLRPEHVRFVGDPEAVL